MCGNGHRFDAARQGYLNLGTTRMPAGDDAAMVARRLEVAEAGVYAPLTDHLVEVARDHLAPAAGEQRLIVDVGAGPGVHLARILEAVGDHHGIAVDASRYAARRAARAHPAITAIVADVWAGLPIADDAVDLLLDVFAPRNGAEFARILAPTGVLVLVTPRPGHLGELTRALGLLGVDPEKTRRVDDELADRFTRREGRPLTWEMSLDRSVATAVATMGPSAHHLDPRALTTGLQRLDWPQTVTGDVEVAVYTPRTTEET